MGMIKNLSLWRRDCEKFRGSEKVVPCGSKRRVGTDVKSAIADREVRRKKAHGPRSFGKKPAVAPKKFRDTGPKSDLDFGFEKGSTARVSGAKIKIHPGSR